MVLVAGSRRGLASHGLCDRVTRATPSVPRGTLWVRVTDLSGARLCISTTVCVLRLVYDPLLSTESTGTLPEPRHRRNRCPKRVPPRV